jgi:hypothetical protein
LLLSVEGMYTGLVSSTLRGSPNAEGVAPDPLPCDEGTRGREPRTAMSDDGEMAADGVDSSTPTVKLFPLHPRP